MLKPAATLEVCGTQAQGGGAASERFAKPGGAVMRFVYATGARPLDGYTIKRGIGLGGFGEVYFALSDAGKEVALKRIQRNLEVELRGVRQCLNLKHPNLVALYDIKYDAEGQAWVVMEYVCGESLKDVLDRNPNGLPPQEVRRWFDGLAAGVGYLHDHGIVHRDLKPGNVFLDADVVKIGDYGLSKFISCSRRSGQTESVGTFHYMAPEIGRGVYGKEIDIYALGIMLFELLTGRVPFDGESSQEIIMKHLTAEPDLTGIAEPYRKAICTALFKDPAKRFGSVAEMTDCLNAHIPAAALAAPPVRSTPPAPRTLYIGGEEESDGIFLGPLKEIVPAEVIAPPEFRPSPRVAREPVAAAVRSAAVRVRDWWVNANLGGPARLVVLVVIVAAVLLNANWLLPLALALGCFYLVYLGVRALVLTEQQPARPAAPCVVPAAAAAAAVPQPQYKPNPTNERAQRCARRKKWRQGARASLSRKPFNERMAELSGSYLLSAVVLAVLCLVMMAAAGKPLDASVFTWTFYAWLTLTGVAGAWLVLTISKLWETRDGEPWLRQFVMLIAGLLLGLIAFSLANFLGVRPTDDLLVRSAPHLGVSMNLVDPNGSLKLPGYLVYFALVFVILRWWSQADPLRVKRLSLWCAGVCALWAWLWHLVWPFPQPWGFLLAAAMSIAIQLSAPWVSTRERTALREQFHQA